MRGVRVAALAAVAAGLAIWPTGDAAVCLALFLAIDAALIVSLLRRRPTPSATSVVPLAYVAHLPLFRRTVPELRSRRPAAIIEAQIAWRQAAGFRRRQGVVRRQSQP